MSQLGRISGQLLKENLLRDGIDLSFKNSFSDTVPILFLNVDSKKIGVNNDSGFEVLNIGSFPGSGSLKSIRLSSDTAKFDNLLFSENSTVTTDNVDEITISASGDNPTILADRLIAGSIEFDDNNITSTIGNIRLIANESKIVSVDSSTEVTQNLNVYGDMLVENNISVLSNLILGNNNSDTIQIFPTIQNNLIPAETNQYSFGSTTVDKSWNDSFFDIVNVDSNLLIDGTEISSPATIYRNTSSIEINILGDNPVAIFEEIQTAFLKFKGNRVSSTQDIRFSAAGSGEIQLLSPTNVTADLTVTGNIDLSGNLRSNSNILIGDQIVDVVQINVEFNQDIVPGQDNLHDLGTADRRWLDAEIPDWTKIGTIRPELAFVNNNLKIGGTNNEIVPLTIDTDITLAPATGIVEIERVRFENSDLTNLSNNALSLAATGTGYYVFEGTNGMIIPAGTTSERPINAEGGSTRWNTELELIEVFDPTSQTWRRSIGSGDVNLEEMADYSYFYTLILG
jgi:hypothetical protein